MTEQTVSLNADEVAAQLHDFSQNKVVNALRSAISTTTTWTEHQLEQRMAEHTSIPYLAFKKYRIHKRLLGGQTTLPIGRVWEGTLPIKARYVGAMRQDDTGAWAGRYFFPGAFIATLRNEMQGVFKRVSHKALPIEEQAVDLPDVPSIAEGVARDAQQEVVRRFRARFI